MEVNKRIAHINNLMLKGVIAQIKELRHCSYCNVNEDYYLISFDGLSAYFVEKTKVLLDISNDEIAREVSGMWGMCSPTSDTMEAFDTGEVVTLSSGTKAVRIKCPVNDKLYYFNEKLYNQCVKYWDGKLTVTTKDGAGILYGWNHLGEVDWLLMGIERSKTDKEGYYEN